MHCVCDPVAVSLSCIFGNEGLSLHLLFLSVSVSTFMHSSFLSGFFPSKIADVPLLICGLHKQDEINAPLDHQNT